MKLSKFLLFIIVISSLLYSCQKDSITPESSKTSKSQFFVSNSWSSEEKKFFSLDNDLPGKLRPRTERVVAYHPRFISAYNEIATQNDRESFITGILTHVGYPLWNQVYIYDHRPDSENVVYIPLIRSDSNFLTGIIAVSYQDDHYVINGMTRNELLANDEGSIKHKLGLALAMWKLELQVFNETSTALDEACCDLKEKAENNPSDEPIDCPLLHVKLCFDTYLNYSWVVGLHNLPIYLDHNQDGIPNSEDQNWYDFMNHYNITQAQFETIVRDFWEENYEEDYGDIDDFWDDWNINGGSDWGEFWDEVFEIFDRIIYEIAEFLDGYEGDPNRDPPCWDGGFTGNPGSNSRSSECHWVYIYDCPTITNPWWNFYNGFELRDVFMNRLSDYWTITLKDEIDFWDLYRIVGDCDPWSEEFEQCVDYEYRKARLAFLANYISDHHVVFDLELFYNLTQECNFSHGFEKCAENIFFINNWSIQTPTNLETAGDIYDCFVTGSNTTQSITIYVDQPRRNNNTPYTVGGRNADGSGNLLAATADNVDVGHTFIGLTQIDGTHVYNKLMGFYPVGGCTPKAPTKDGAFLVDEDHPYDVSLTLPISVGELLFIAAWMDTNADIVPNYDLNTFNCTDWATGIFNIMLEADLPDAYADWFLGGGSSPGPLGEYIRNMTLPTGATRVNCNMGEECKSPLASCHE